MFKIIQITDTHINADPSTRIFGLVNTEATFLDVLEKVKHEKPDLVIATGDLSQDGSIASYQRLKSHLNTLNCDVYAIYGNHDIAKNFDEHLLGGNIKKTPLLKTPFANIIFLNSLFPGRDSGVISDEELERLDTSLDEHDNCIPVIHHHFVPLDSTIDKYILENRDLLLNVLLKHKDKIKFCVTGHVHGFHQVEFEGIKIYSSLSTCIQFAKTKTLMFENKKPGYTVYSFNNDVYQVAERTL
jgi:Icc protein